MYLLRVSCIYEYKISPLHFIDEKTSMNRAENAKLLRFIEAYREYGHENANLDPLKIRER